MSTIHGDTSHYLEKKRNLHLITLLIIVIAFLSLSIMATLFNVLHISQPITWLVAFASLAGYVLFKAALFKEDKSIDHYISGIQGEAVVLQELQRLTDDWHIFPDIRLSDRAGNIDMVAISPSGHIFAIEVKNSPGYKSAYSCKHDIHQTVTGAMSLHQFIQDRQNVNAFVIPMLVYANTFAMVRFGFKKIDHAHVVQIRFLLKILKNYEQKENAKLSNPTPIIHLFANLKSR